MENIRIVFSSGEGEILRQFPAVLYDNESAAMVRKLLPLKYRLVFWGESMAIDLPPWQPQNDEETMDVATGDIVFWPAVSKIIIFYGPTPVSEADTPKVLGPVISIGRFDSDPKEYSKFLHSVPRLSTYVSFVLDD